MAISVSGSCCLELCEFEAVRLEIFGAVYDREADFTFSTKIAVDAGTGFGTTEVPSISEQLGLEA